MQQSNPLPADGCLKLPASSGDLGEALPSLPEGFRQLGEASLKVRQPVSQVTGAIRDVPGALSEVGIGLLNARQGIAHLGDAFRSIRQPFRQGEDASPKAPGRFRQVADALLRLFIHLRHFGNACADHLQSSRCVTEPSRRQLQAAGTGSGAMRHLCLP
jgi:hypothetical protein